MATSAPQRPAALVNGPQRAGSSASAPQEDDVLNRSARRRAETVEAQPDDGCVGHACGVQLQVRLLSQLVA